MKPKPFPDDPRIRQRLRPGYVLEQFLNDEHLAQRVLHKLRRSKPHVEPATPEAA